MNPMKITAGVIAACVWISTSVGNQQQISEKVASPITLGVVKKENKQTVPVPQTTGVSEPVAVEVTLGPVPETRNGDAQPSKEIVDIITKNFGDFGPEGVHQALMIARCESSYNPAAHRSSIGKIGSGDHGLFQINHVHLPALRKAGFTVDDLFKPEINASIARELVNERISKNQPKWADWKQSRKCHGVK